MGLLGLREEARDRPSVQMIGGVDRVVLYGCEVIAVAVRLLLCMVLLLLMLQDELHRYIVIGRMSQLSRERGHVAIKI